MSNINERCLEVFPTWLKSLGEDVQTILGALKIEDLDNEVRSYLCGGINYLFKSLDLIPDGIDDIGYLDDAFVLRLSVKAAMEGEVGGIDAQLKEKMDKLVEDTKVLEEFLEEGLFKRLDAYARDLKNGAARGRMVSELLEKPELFREFAAETESFVKEFTAPGFSRDEKNLIKLTAFFDAKLPK